jgi:hypothetical protein
MPVVTVCETVALSVWPVERATAVTVAFEVTRKGAKYCGELAVGVVPSSV